MKICYAKSPLSIDDGIPSFSLTDRFTANYEKIACDHLDHQDRTGQNPFMREQYWREIEESTHALLIKYAFRPCSTQVPSHASLRVLDVGVGTGRFLARYPQFERYGMDISMRYLKRAAACGIEVCMSKVEEMPYRDGFFDVVVCTDVLEHVIDLHLCVTNILKVLKDGGYLIVRVPYREDLSGYLSPSSPYEFIHLRNFDENSLGLLFRKVFGLQVCEWTLSGRLSGPLRLGSRIRLIRGPTLRALRLLGRLWPWAEFQLAQVLRGPTEINIVVRRAKVGTYRPHE